MCVCVCACVHMCMSVCTQSHPTLCNHIHSLPGSSVSGIFQARILEWVAIYIYISSYFFAVGFNQSSSVYYCLISGFFIWKSIPYAKCSYIIWQFI